MSRYVRYKLTLKKSAGGCDGCAKSVAERSHPTSEARGRSREDPMPKGRRPRGVTERPRSGAEAGRTPCPKGGGQEELLHVRGRGSGRECQTAMAQERRRGATPRPRSGGWPRGDTQRPRSGAATRGLTPRPRPGAVAGRSNPTPEEPWLHRCRRA